MRCLSCQYSLENLTPVEGVHRCPECGRAFDPNDAATWELEVMAVRRIVKRIWLVAFILFLLLFIAMVIPLLRSYPVFG